MKQYYVYIISNIHNTTLYIGVTNDLQRRMYEHKNKLLDGFSNKYNLTKLVYFEIYEDINEAIKKEKGIKNLLRRKKNGLIGSKNPRWLDLSEGILSVRASSILQDDNAWH